MSTVMTNVEFVEKIKDVAQNYKTLYVMGCFGAPMTAANKTRYINNGASKNYNAKAEHKAAINAASADTFGFDCVCLIKGILWGWKGDKSKVYGGATYASNGVPDINADAMIKVCSEVSTDFSKITPGEAVWMQGHIGVYIGDGLAVECTPSWGNKVQITACNCAKNGYNRRNWTKHGKLPYVSYDTAPNTANVSGASASSKPSAQVVNPKPVTVTSNPNPDVFYQAYTVNRWLPIVKNDSDYAGLFKNTISGVYARLSSGNIWCAVHLKGGKWLPEVKNREDYAGILGKNIDGVMIRTDTGKQIQYRVHLKSTQKWLPWVTGCNQKDNNNGYAGIIGKEIDGIQIKFS